MIRTGLFALLCGLALNIPCRAAGSPAAEKLLDLALHPPKRAFSGKRLVTVWYGKKSRAVEQRVFFQPPGRWRHEVLSPTGKPLKVIVQRAGKEWLRGKDPRVILERDIRGIRRGELDRKALRALLTR